MARLPDAKRDDFPEELKYVWDAVATDGGDPPNIFKALGRNPNILRAYLRLGNGLWRHCGLDVKHRELAILRSAFNTGSRYEWHQHVRIGRDAGLSDDEIRAVGDPESNSLFDDRVKALLTYVDALNGQGRPSDATFKRMRDAWGEETTVGVTVLVPFYEMTAKFLSAMQVEPEETFVGWGLEH